jgi:hypothetical protein
MFAEIIERAARKKIEREEAEAAHDGRSRRSPKTSAKKATKLAKPKGSGRRTVSATRR